MFSLNRHTSIVLPKNNQAKNLRFIINILQRDIRKVIGFKPLLVNKVNENSIILNYCPEENLPAEQYTLRTIDKQLELKASDELGFIYGALYFSKEYLGVTDWWYWADLEPEAREVIELQNINYTSPVRKVRYRGWFINDETSILGWYKGVTPPDFIWEQIFETLLRLGGNMVIAGSALPAEAVHHELASQMGLYLTHHHIEYLGTEFFSRRFPDLKPSYSEHQELFESLWREAVLRHRDDPTVWIIGYRGQGDRPFWIDDKAFMEKAGSENKTEEELKGEYLSEVIHRQMQILQEEVENPVVATYLYAEAAELYRAGKLKLPEGVIKIWADNGYGKMVSRRGHALEDKSIAALPEAEDKGLHGIYYHAAFHDGRLHSNNLAMMQSPDIIETEMKKCFDASADHYWIVNCGIIRPHQYVLDYIAKLWNEGMSDQQSHRSQWVSTYLSEESKLNQDFSNLYKKYFDSLGLVHENRSDYKIGELFYHSNARMLIRLMISGKPPESHQDFYWGTGEMAFPEQIKWFEKKCLDTLPSLIDLEKQAANLEAQLKGSRKKFFQDNLLFQIRLHLYSCRGFASLCRGLAALYEDYGNQVCYIYAHDALEDYSKINTLFQAGEKNYRQGMYPHQMADKWKDFYRGDWTIRCLDTAKAIQTLIDWCALVGDGGSLVIWKKVFMRDKDLNGDCKIGTQPPEREALLEAMKVFKEKEGKYTPVPSTRPSLDFHP